MEIKDIELTLVELSEKEMAEVGGGFKADKCVGDVGDNVKKKCGDPTTTPPVFVPWPPA